MVQSSGDRIGGGPDRSRPGLPARSGSPSSRAGFGRRLMPWPPELRWLTFSVDWLSSLPRPWFWCWPDLGFGLALSFCLCLWRRPCPRFPAASARRPLVDRRLDALGGKGCAAICREQVAILPRCSISSSSIKATPSPPSAAVSASWSACTVTGDATGVEERAEATFERPDWVPGSPYSPGWSRGGHEPAEWHGTGNRLPQMPTATAPSADHDEGDPTGNREWPPRQSR